MEKLPSKKDFKSSFAPTERYERTMQHFKSKITVVIISPISYLSQDFKRFVILLQTTNQMFSMLYSKFRKLLLGNLSKFMKDDVILDPESKILLSCRKILNLDLKNS